MAALAAAELGADVGWGAGIHAAKHGGPLCARPGARQQGEERRSGAAVTALRGVTRVQKDYKGL